MSMTAGELDTAASTIRQQWNNLVSTLTPLATTWVGAAGAKFQQTVPLVEAEMVKIETALANLASAINTTNTGNQQVDSQEEGNVSTAGSSFAGVGDALMPAV